MKGLIAVMNCRAYGARAQAQRDTWVKDVDPTRWDVRFFVGGPGPAPSEDTIALDVPDDYHHLPMKVQAARRWALGQGYCGMERLDDDVYLAADRLTIPSLVDYQGRVRGPSGQFPAPYCSGFSYWTSSRAMKALICREWKKDIDIAEDRWTGNELYKAGILPSHDPRRVICRSKNNSISGNEGPLQGNDIIAACEFNPQSMRDTHQDYKSGRRTGQQWHGLPAGSLDRVCIMIKTFLRDGYLLACLEGLRKRMPEAKVVVVDDGYSSREKVPLFAEMNRQGHSCVVMPFDSGFGEKANYSIAQCDREYVLVGSDDFDFSDPRVKPGIEKMVAVLDANPSIGVASGWVDGKPYEFCWDRPEPGTLQEVRRFHGSGSVSGIAFHSCDLTVNYSLLRRSMLDTVRWDGGEVKIGGGEHAAFFLDVQKEGWGVCVVDGANINQFKYSPVWEHKTYRSHRGRARVPGRPCLKKRGIDKYILADGTVELS